MIPYDCQVLMLREVILLFTFFVLAHYSSGKIFLIFRHLILLRTVNFFISITEVRVEGIPCLRPRKRLGYWINLVGSSQASVNLSTRLAKKELNYFLYSIASWKPAHDYRFKFVAGLYYTNSIFVGGENRAGVLLGYEIKVAKDWYLIGHFISRNNDSALSVFGAMKTISK